MQFCYTANLSVLPISSGFLEFHQLLFTVMNYFIIPFAIYIPTLGKKRRRLKQTYQSSRDSKWDKPLPFFTSLILFLSFRIHVSFFSFFFSFFFKTSFLPFFGSLLEMVLTTLEPKDKCCALFYKPQNNRFHTLHPDHILQALFPAE